MKQTANEPAFDENELKERDDRLNEKDHHMIEAAAGDDMMEDEKKRPLDDQIVPGAIINEY